jgi:hypothetical protein
MEIDRREFLKFAGSSAAQLSLATFGLGLAASASPQSNALPDAAVTRRVLDDFKAALDERWSYRHANGADFDGAIAALRRRASARISLDDLGIELHKILALGIDGHSRVVGYKLPGSHYLPFLIEPEGQRFIAFRSDRGSFLADRFPYLTRMDGRDVSEWCDAAAVLVPKGSPPYLRHRCLALMRHIEFVREVMQLPRKDTIEVVLAGSDGNSRRTLKLQLDTSLPAYGVWPRINSRILEGNVAYLRLPYMDSESSTKEIKDWMPKFRDTRGLIIDVRDNDGGDRDALRLIYSYLAAPTDGPRVFTAAAYRLHPANNEDRLARGHFMYSANAKEWTETQRQAVADFAKTFQPKWELPKEQFSDWHYMALTRLNDADIYQYRGPVIVLMNGKCFSATDVFLAGLKGMKNVTLLGTSSSGGSADTQEVFLGTTPLRLRIGSIASFQSDGRLFDGNGVQPDVVVQPLPEYYIGGSDNVLTKALKRIRLVTP